MISYRLTESTLPYKEQLEYMASLGLLLLADGVGDGIGHLPVQLLRRELFAQQVCDRRARTAGGTDRAAIGGQAADVLLLVDGDQIADHKTAEHPLP